MLVLYPMIFHCILLHPSDAQSFRCSTPNFSKKHYCFTLFYYRFLLYTQHLLWFLRLALPIPSGPPASGLDFPLIAPRSLRTRRSVSMEQCDPQRRATAAATAANPDLSGTKTKTKGSFLDGPWWFTSNSPNIIWVWVKIRYPNNWMVNTKLDIHICGPTSVFHFDPHPFDPLYPFSEKARFYGFLGHGGPQGFIPVNRGSPLICEVKETTVLPVAPGKSPGEFWGDGPWATTPW